MSLPFLDLRSLVTFQQPGLLASGVKIELTLCRPQLKVENNTHMPFFPDKFVRVPYNRRGHATPAYITEEHCHEDPDYRTGLGDVGNVRGREDPAT
jgi:hypothetical protein